MKLQDIWTRNPACCGPDMPMEEVAKVMVDSDCGEIPVVVDSGRPIGVVTDRDMACRGIAEGYHFGAGGHVDSSGDGDATR